MPATLATETIELLGLRVRRLVRGTGPPVLVLPGWGASIEAVQPIVAGLEPVATVHALDLPGFGESDPPPEPWGVEDYQRLVAAYMDRAGLAGARVDSAPPTEVAGPITNVGPPTESAAPTEIAGPPTEIAGPPTEIVGPPTEIPGPPAIVGHSNGGRIAIRMAATEPERVGKLVLVDAAGIRPKRTLHWYRRVALAKVGKHAARRLGAPGRRLRDALVGRVASTDYAAAGELRPTLVRLVNAQLRPHLPAIKSPTLLIWGEKDADTPLWMGREMERLIPDAGLVVLEGAGHFSYLDQPDRFARIVSHFLAPPRPAPPPAPAPKDGKDDAAGRAEPPGDARSAGPPDHARSAGPPGDVRSAGPPDHARSAEPPGGKGGGLPKKSDAPENKRR